MFGLKLKSWMEAHLGRPRHKSTSHQNQKRVPKDSISSSTVAASTSHCSSSVIATSATSISTSSSSTNTSCSNGSTTTAIVGLTTGLASNNPTFPSTTSDHLTHHQEKNSNFQTRSSDFTTSSTTAVSPSVGSESVTALAAAATAEGLVKSGGGVCIISKQKGDASGTRVPEIESHALGESDHHEQVPANCSSNNNSNGCSRPTVTTSVSNSTSILSGSFSNSLSSPDTGYSTDGYSPKSVYPALSFDSSSSTSSGNCKSTTSTSKSSYTISSLASSELLHPSKQTSTILSSMGESCPVQNDFDEYPSTAPSPSSPAALTSSTPFSQSCSSGISTGTSDSSNNGFPKGAHQVHHHHHTQLETSPRLLVQPKTQQQHSITEDELKKQQVIIGGDVEAGGQKKPSIETRCLELSQQKLSPAASSSSKEDITTARVADSLTKQFAQFSIDFKNQDIISAKHNGRTHRRAESMDARTPSHEDYKPLVQDEDENGCGDDGGGNSSLVMTGTQGKNIRTSFIINGSGHVVEFSSYKNAYSICSPRRERTRIKTNPWIILNPKSGNNSSDKESHANPQSNSSASEEESADKRENVDKMKSSSFSCTSSSKPIIPLENGIIETIKGRDGDRDGGESGNIGKTDHTLGSSDPRKANNREINKRVEGTGQHETKLEEDDEQFTEDETGIIDHGSSSSLLFRISTSASASDSGKGTLEPTTNRNSTESSCLLSDSTTASTRNSIISHETEPSGSRSGRSSSGESISSSHQHRQPEDDTLGHASTTSPDTRLFTSEHQKKQHQHIHQRVTVSSSTVAIGTSFQEESRKNIAPSSEGGSEEPRTFRNAAVATDICPELSSSAKFPKSASVSVGVGTTGSNKSGKFQPIMVDKETDILSDWGNTDEDGDEEIETDGDRNDNETVTPAPSSPGTDVDRALFSQSTSSATDIDFGDSSAATQASSTAVFPPSSLIRQPQRFSSGGGGGNNNNGKSGAGGNRENGARFHYSNNEGNGFSNGNDGGSGETLIATSQMLPGSYDHQHHYQHGIINVNLATAPAAGSGSCYPSVPIIRPVLAAVAQHQGPNGIPDAYTYDIAATNSGPGVLVNHCSELVNHHHTLIHPHAGSDLASMYYGGGVVPNFNLDDDESVYPQIKGSSTTHSKGIARGALGFLRKIFKKGACSSQRHSPDSVKGKKSRGKSDNNLANLGLGSPLLTISEPLSNPRYSAVLTSKKQMNPAINSYFLTPTPNSFRRKSGTGTDSSDSKSSKQNSSGKSVKTDIIRLPQGTLSPTQQQSLIQRQTVHATSSSHSSGSSCSGLSGNGIPVQTCSTFFSPGSTNFHHQLSACAQPGAGPVAGAGNNSNLPSSQSNTNTNSTSGSSSVHSLMSTSTSAASVGNNGNLNRPPSQNQSKTPVPSRDPNYYANSSPIPRQSVFMSNNGNCNSNNIARGNSHRMSPPPLISEHSPYLSDGKNPQHQNPIHSHGSNQGAQSSCRRDHHPHSQSPAMRSVAPYESPRLPASSSSATTAASARMNSPSFNNYSPIHRLVVTGGTHLLNRANPNCPSGNPPAVNPASSTGLIHYPQSGGIAISSGESPLPVPRYSNLHNSGVNGNNNGTGAGNNNNPAGFPMNSQIVNRPGSHHHHATSSPSPLINHRYPSTSSPHQYPSTISSSQQQQSVPGHFFASPSPILRNPRYQYITSSNQNSPILNASKRLNMLPPSHSHVQIHPSSNGLPSNPNGPPPLLTTFAPLPSSQLSSSAPRESLINNNSFNANTITGSPNLNSSDPFSQRTRQVVSTSLSYNEFENLSRQQQTFLFTNNGNNSQQHLPISATPHPPPPSHHQHIISQPQQQQQLLHQSQKGKIHHQNHYYSSPIVKGAHPPSSLKQTFWNSSEEQGRILCGNNEGTRQHQQRMNQNLRFNSFLVGHRQLPRFYHTQWGLQERIYETVDSDGEQTASDEMSAVGAEYDQDGNEIDRTSELSLPVEVHPRMMKPGFNRDEAEHLRIQEGNFLLGQREGTMRTSNVMGYNPDSIAPSAMMNAENQEQTSRSKSKRSKPKSLSASGKPFPRPVVALPMMPGTFLSETETRLLEADKESDRKYKRLINEAEALLKEISVEKCKRSGTTHDNNPFRLEDCPQSDPLRRKAYDCWALRRLQQELAGCCASPPVLHRSRLNLQSPLTPTVTNNPFLSHFQQMGHPSLPQQVPYMNSSGVVDNNQNSFDF